MRAARYLPGFHRVTKMTVGIQLASVGSRVLEDFLLHGLCCPFHSALMFPPNDANAEADPSNTAAKLKLAQLVSLQLFLLIIFTC